MNTSNKVTVWYCCITSHIIARSLLLTTSKHHLNDVLVRVGRLYTLLYYLIKSEA